MDLDLAPTTPPHTTPHRPPEDTAVLLHGDHGYHLGEYGQWKKNTNWEECVKTPLIVKVPWLDGIAGTHSSALAELVDIMPTLADLAGEGGRGQEAAVLAISNP
jgi:arylsulfatase A-like enzyme